MSFDKTTVARISRLARIATTPAEQERLAGELGGILAWVIIGFTLFWLGPPVSELAGLYQSQFQLQGLGVGDALLMWMAGGVLGLLGAWLAVSRHLGAIEPR